MKVLELTNVFKDYKLANKTKFNALKDINVSFEKGELVSIVGESGSGKSTLMNLIGGLDSDYTGEIKISGKDLKSFNGKDLDDYRKKKIGFVFQSFNLIPHLSILDNVTIALTLSNEKESVKKEKAEAILDKLGLKNQLHKKPTQLSGGQKQRVAIARALINNPDIILADEPTGALDSSTTMQILDILKDIADEGKLVLMVTHSEKVASISSRIVEISDGQIIRDDLNKKYKKNKIKLFEEKSTEKNQANSENFDDIKLDNAEIKKKEKKTKEKHLSLFSAIRLSFHNMWASRVKNFLMAFGVSISLIAMITMLAFGSGLTGYINSLANSYSNPLIVTVAKKEAKNPDDPMGGMGSFLNPSSFTDEEKDKVLLDINTYLDEHYPELDYRVKEEDISYGFQMFSGFSKDGANVIFGEGEDDKAGIFYLYTTPTYYDEKQLLAGHLSTDKIDENGIGEIMFSNAILKPLGLENMDEALGKVVEIDVNFKNVKVKQKVRITGIIDVNMFDGFLVTYIDYNLLDKLVYDSTLEQNGAGIHIQPTSIYIKTDAESTTNIINNYLSTRDDLTGSVENQLANMFNEMMSTFSIALAVISGISLFVALIMILVVMYMSVSERTREIGVLKSIGARKRDIKKIFSTESFLIGLLSGIVGIALSLLFGGLLTIILNVTLGFAPIAYEWWFFAVALGIAIIISVLAGLYPASKAAKLDPVESLRHE